VVFDGCPGVAGGFFVVGFLGGVAALVGVSHVESSGLSRQEALRGWWRDGVGR